MDQESIPNVIHENKMFFFVWRDFASHCYLWDVYTPPYTTTSPLRPTSVTSPFHQYIHPWPLATITTPVSLTSYLYDRRHTTWLFLLWSRLDLDTPVGSFQKVHLCLPAVGDARYVKLLLWFADLFNLTFLSSQLVMDGVASRGTFVLVHRSPCILIDIPLPAHIPVPTSSSHRHHDPA